MTLPVIEGDIVRFRNSKSLYKIKRTDSKLILVHEISGNVRGMPPPNQLVLVDRKPTRIQENYVYGFDALKSAGKDDSVYRPGDAGYSNDSVDAMRYATHGVLQSSKTPFKMDMNDCERLVSDFHTAHPKVKNFINKLNGQGQGGRDMSININSLVAKVTDNIKDAELVTRFFGHELNEASIKDEYFVRDNYESLLEEAQEREEKRLAKLENSCA